MAIIPVSKDDIENFTIVTTPRRSYSFLSSSLGKQTTGSIQLYPRFSTVSQKSTTDFVTENGEFTDKNFLIEYEHLNNEVRQKRWATSDKIINKQVDDYFSLISSASLKTNHKVYIERFSPLDDYTDSNPHSRYTSAKDTIKDCLIPFYRTQYSNCNWAYTNYHSLNFFTVDNDSTLIPTGSALVYPNIQNSDLPSQTGYMSGTYCLSGAFSFDFYINPRYQFDGIDDNHFKAGTILHLSSSYALSLVTGSSKDPAGLPNAFRLQLQLSHSADIPPSEAVEGTYPSRLVFLSDDNSLLLNNWHHVVVRWGTSIVNDGTGSFVIDGTEKGNFVVPTSTINQPFYSARWNPNALIVGNYYEGRQNASSVLTDQCIFFLPAIASRTGVSSITSSLSSLNISDNNYTSPTLSFFRHPLKAEIHDLSIKRYYVKDKEISSKQVNYSDVTDISKYAFYLPPFFTQESPVRMRSKISNRIGGVLQSPYHSISGTTDDPFNVAVAFGSNGHYINLENFTREFTNSEYPRLIGLEPIVLNGGATNISINANDSFYSTAGIAKRNLTILPCDDGNFQPNYEFLRSERYTDKYRSSVSTINDWSSILLDDLIKPRIFTNNDPVLNNFKIFTDELYGIMPDQQGGEVGTLLQKFFDKVENQLENSPDDFDRGIYKEMPLPIYEKLRETSSNQITIFNISNLFYGKKIQPGSFQLIDSGISGSQGSVKLTIKDDKLGSLYRADSLTSHATQNCVGNIFYDEGIVLIKNPHLFFFGKQQYEMSFKGVSDIYTSKYEILAQSGLINSSSSETYTLEESVIKASGDPIDDNKFVYISGINLHDENMNVVAKVKMAQPIIKRHKDKILFKFTLDY